MPLSLAYGVLSALKDLVLSGPMVAGWLGKADEKARAAVDDREQPDNEVDPARLEEGLAKPAARPTQGGRRAETAARRKNDTAEGNAVIGQIAVLVQEEAAKIADLEFLRSKSAGLRERAGVVRDAYGAAARAEASSVRHGEGAARLAPGGEAASESSLR